MATEKNEGIFDHISNFSQGGIVQRTHLGDDRKAANSFSRSILFLILEKNTLQEIYDGNFAEVC